MKLLVPLLIWLTSPAEFAPIEWAGHPLQLCKSSVIRIGAEMELLDRRLGLSPPKQAGDELYAVRTTSPDRSRSEVNLPRRSAAIRHPEWACLTCSTIQASAVGIEHGNLIDHHVNVLNARAAEMPDLRLYAPRPAGSEDGFPSRADRDLRDLDMTRSILLAFGSPPKLLGDGEPPHSELRQVGEDGDPRNDQEIERLDVRLQLSEEPILVALVLVCDGLALLAISRIVALLSRKPSFTPNLAIGALGVMTVAAMLLAYGLTCRV